MHNRATFKYKSKDINIVCTPTPPLPPLPISAGGGLSLRLNSQKGRGLTGNQFSEGGLLGKMAVTFFMVGGLPFLHKKYFLSVVTKNSNCKILTRDLVTFKRSDGVKDEKF